MERRNWVERNIFRAGHDASHAYSRVEFQKDSERPITGRIETYTGHGLQQIGMGLELWEQNSMVRDIYAAAERASGIDVAALSFDGPEEELNRTENAQVCNATFSVACKVGLVSDRPILFRKYPKVVTGQSAGFGVAAFEGGAFGNPWEFRAFEKMISFYRDRGRIMQEVSDQVGGGLMVVGVRKKKGERATAAQVEMISEIREKRGEWGVDLALDVAPDQVILGGTEEELVRLKEGLSQYEDAGIRSIRSKASSGPFHIERLMKPAEQPIRELAKAMRFEDTKCLVVANTEKRFLTDSDDIENEMGNLTVKPVLGRAMDALVAENCRGVIYFIGGERAIAQDMFVESAGEKKPIYRSKKALLAAGITVVGTGTAIAIAARSRRKSEDNK